MRLINADALKKCARVVFDKDLGRLRVVDVSDIDNAPTINIPNYGGEVVPDMLQGWKYEDKGGAE